MGKLTEGSNPSLSAIEKQRTSFEVLFYFSDGRCPGEYGICQSGVCKHPNMYCFHYYFFQI
ncbi:hypothetical protein, partial [Victivallis vadensis]|uniref:hypothetical protein n=1 Tax=Victivallis vadensis TaxID=172901 RepID=UPI002671AF71